jgi:hypothetical protein
MKLLPHPNEKVKTTIIYKLIGVVIKYFSSPKISDHAH